MNTTTRTRTLLISAMLPLFAAPMLGQAEAADPTLDACVKAFVSSNFEKERPYSVVSKDLQSFDPQASTYRISLSAKGKKSGKHYASATCVIEGDRVILTMSGKSQAVPVGGETILSAR